MYIRKSVIILFGIVLLSFLISVYLYPQMPEKMASHWNAKGEVDGCMSKFWALFLSPLILTAVVLFFLILPRIDPLRANIEEFRKYYDGFIILVSVFMLSIQLQVILWNFGIKVRPTLTLPIGLGLLMYYSGILCENSKRNWFMGIKTPWTLSSDMVWQKTHKIAGKLLKIAAIITFGGVFCRNHVCRLLFLIVPLAVAVFYPAVYSYFEYQKEVKRSDSAAFSGQEQTGG